MSDKSRQNKNNIRPKVLLITASVGAGHNQAARALEEELRARDVAEIKCVDSLDFTPRWFRAKYAGGYALSFTRLPFFYGLGYYLLDRPSGSSRTAGEQYRLWQERKALRRFADFVREFDPDVVVYTHFLAPVIIRQMIRRGEINPVQMMVVTDIKIHRWWYSEGIDKWFIAQEVSRQQLLNWNIDPERIVVSGIPLRSQWDVHSQSQIHDAQPIREAFSLPDSKKIVLLSGGTAFTCGPIERIARRIVSGRDDICVVVLGGRNKKLLGKAAALSETREGKIIPIGFTDRLHELTRCASLMVTKAGGLITTECLAAQLPMVILKPVPGQESGNAQFYAEKGVGVIARNAKQAARLVHQLIDDESRLGDMSQRTTLLDFPGRRTIVDTIIGTL